VKRIFVFICVLLILIAGYLYVSYEEPVPSKENVANAPLVPEVVRESEVVVPHAIEAVEPENIFAGRVVHKESGVPVSDATLRFGWQEEGKTVHAEFVTLADGRFSLPTDEANRIGFRVSHASLVSQRNYTTIILEDYGPGSEYLVKMISGGEISGRVYDAETGEGLADIHVSSRQDFKPGATTDANGWYQIGGIRAGERRVFIGHATGYIDPKTVEEGLSVFVVQGEEVAGVDFALERGVFSKIGGKVVSEVGIPVSDASVTVLQLDPTHLNSKTYEDKTSSDGTFQVSELPVADGYYVSAVAGQQISDEVGPLGLTGKGIDNLVVTLRSGGSISGRIVDSSSGNPITDSDLTNVLSFHQSGQKIWGGQSSRLDDEGRFMLSNLSKGQFKLYVDQTPGVYFTGFSKADFEVELDYGEHVKGVRLAFDYEAYLIFKKQRDEGWSSGNRQSPSRPKIGKIVGRVVEAISDEPIPDFELQFIDPQSGHHRSVKAVHDAEGLFEIRETSAKSLTLVVSAAEFEDFTRNFVGSIEPQPEHELLVRLNKGAIVHGRVVDGASDPVSGAEIYVDADPFLMESMSDGVHPDARTGEDGSFTLNTLSDGTVDLYARHPGFAVGMVEARAVVTGPSNCTIILTAGGLIEGTVTVDGQPATNQPLLILDGERRNIHITDLKTNDEGVYRMDHLIPGRYTVYTSTGEMSSRRRLHREGLVEEGLVTVLNFSFDEFHGTLVGDVTLDGKIPFSMNARISIETEHGIEKRNSEVFRGGRFIVDNLPEGEAKVFIHANFEDGTMGRDTFDVSIRGGEVRRDFAVTSE